MRCDIVGMLVPVEKLRLDVVRQEDVLECGTAIAQRDECVERDIAVRIASFVDVVGGGKARTSDHVARKAHSPTNRLPSLRACCVDPLWIRTAKQTA